LAVLSKNGKFAGENDIYETPFVAKAQIFFLPHTHQRSSVNTFCCTPKSFLCKTNTIFLVHSFFFYPIRLTLQISETTFIRRCLGQSVNQTMYWKVISGPHFNCGADGHDRKRMTHGAAAPVR
jgi:hypothetical protein